jgi:hypothetical protein
MATIILGTAGQIFGGPIGGLLGTAIGGAIDRNLLGGSGRPRESGRISNPALQSATYGEPIPIIVGRMRTAGNLIWSSGITERSSTSGGGKRSGPTTTTYSYAASFAVGLVTGRIVGVGRIWADGKMIRGGDGTFATPVVMRLHDGGEDQAVDPLIAAAQGSDGTPAFRGMSYVVFEDMPLADFGNRIPNLTFEIIADDATVDAGVAMARIAAIAGYQGLTTAGHYPALTGHMVGRAGSLADALAPLLAIADAAVTSREGLGIVTTVDAGISVPSGVADARWPGDNRAPERQRRTSSDAQPGCLELAFYDPDRDYQPGLTRVRRGARSVTDQRSIAAAMTAGDARQLAISLLATGEAARLEQTLRLPWRWLGLGAGETIMMAGSPALWRIRERRFENFVVHLDLVRVRAAMPAPTSEPRAFRQSTPFKAADALTPVGATQLHILDLPALPGDPTETPRLWVAANSASDRWRRAGVAVSVDGGASYSSIGEIVGGTVIGTMLTVLEPGHVDRWDRSSAAEVELITERDWLEGRSQAAVMAGGNLALVGDELLQFAEVEALAPRRFRLRGLLRGRRGTEAAVHGHRAGERFVLLDPQRMLAYDPPLDALGRNLHFVASGPGDGDEAPVSAEVGGAALRPLAPCRLRVRHEAGGLTITWVRRSRSGYGWHDFVDAPLGEAAESYTVTLRRTDRVIQQQRVNQPAFFCSTSQITADGSGQPLEILVAQDSALVGPGLPASITISMTEGKAFQ